MLRSLGLLRWGGRAAFFALWLQLALTAGHMHPEDLFGPSGGLVLHDHGARHQETLSRDRSGSSPGDAQPSLDTDVCAICAAMQMVAVAVPPLPFRLQAPLT